MALVASFFKIIPRECPCLCVLLHCFCARGIYIYANDDDGNNNKRRQRWWWWWCWRIIRNAVLLFLCNRQPHPPPIMRPNKQTINISYFVLFVSSVPLIPLTSLSLCCIITHSPSHSCSSTKTNKKKTAHLHLRSSSTPFFFFFLCSLQPPPNTPEKKIFWDSRLTAEWAWMTHNLEHAQRGTK